MNNTLTEYYATPYWILRYTLLDITLHPTRYYATPYWIYSRGSEGGVYIFLETPSLKPWEYTG